MDTTLDIILSNSDPNKAVNVSYNSPEPISILLQRIYATLRSGGTFISRHDLFLNSIRLENHNQTMNHYRIFGYTLTYRAIPAHLPDQDRGRGLSASSYYRVSEGSFLHLFLPRPSIVIFPEIVLTDDSVAYFGIYKIHFSGDAPPGRVPTNGANVKCACKCTYAHKVIYQKGLGTFELSRFTSIWKNVQTADCYHMVNADDDGTIWRRLVMSGGLNHCGICTICLEPLQEVEALKCGHRFHAACIERWKESYPICLYSRYLSADTIAEVTNAVGEDTSTAAEREE
ncbi:hypothetical protein BG015_003220 [Linnemannia schmuckeri]|uniref:RING-type domain-containing protein n=1 Tax=Linnemannia schmuckeri TaxID=64567 RepID=A0A9P5V5F8_9FUNG|nr:hypothetical protein BG015_003220 [Linnemannia schmuckeri]